MRRAMVRLFGLILLLAVGVTGLTSTTVWAAKLLCVTKEHLAGEDTVGNCLAKGDEFAIVDEYGVVRILSPREIELTKQFNPDILNQRAFGVRKHEKAPEVKKVFGSVPLPSK